MEPFIEKPAVTRWAGPGDPTDRAIILAFHREDLVPHRWANGPGDIYAEHAHPYHKVLVVSSGSITFRLPASGEEIELGPGDRLDLPAGVIHSAIVGPQGVNCLEAWRE